MNTPTDWHTLTAEARHRRNELWRHVRAWAAGLHASTLERALPGRVLAALDATGQPQRERLVACRDHTTRELAEAAADDLWDAAAVVWAMVNANPAHRHRLHHVVAELQDTGRWLAVFPVQAAAHERAMAELFAAEVVA